MLSYTEYETKNKRYWNLCKACWRYSFIQDTEHKYAFTRNCDFLHAFTKEKVEKLVPRPAKVGSSSLAVFLLLFCALFFSCPTVALMTSSARERASEALHRLKLLVALEHTAVDVGY